jgi:hypothetical protein
MSRLPQLEAQLVAAAGGRRSRARRPLLIGAGALAVAACVIAALLLAPASEPQRRERPVTVPETVPAATLVEARALAEKPLARSVKIPDDRLPAEAKRFIAQTPYPPGMSDDHDWAKVKRTINTAVDLQVSVEYRAYCMWLNYWVTGADRAGASAVLEQVPRWPTQRQKDHHLTYWQNKILTQMRKGDVAAMRESARACTVS